jgi:hypothetical protein
VLANWGGVMSTNATGRLDLFVMNLSQALCAQFQAKTGLDLWANGGERITRAFIDERGIPTEPVDLPMTIARNVGILPARGTFRTIKRNRKKVRRVR